MNNTLDLGADFDVLYEMAAAKFGRERVERALVDETCKLALELCHDALAVGPRIIPPELVKISGSFARQVEVVVEAAIRSSSFSFADDARGSRADLIEISGLEIFKLAIAGRCSLRTAAANVVAFQSAEYIFESFKQGFPAYLLDEVPVELERAATAEVRRNILSVLEVDDLTEKYIRQCRRLH